MKEEGTNPDCVSFVSILKACSSGAALHEGRLIHAEIIKSGLETDIYMRSTLIDTYAKCECLESACKVFDKLPVRDVVTWGAMIAGYSMHNKYELALQCFQNMVQEGVQPNEVTFICILSAFSHLGLITEGCHQLVLMRELHGITPTVKHYNCIVDLLGRAGYLNEAENILNIVPFKYNVVGWTSLLSNCRFYGNVELGRRCFDNVLTVDPRYPSVHVLMSKIYDDTYMLEHADKIQELRIWEDVPQKAGMAYIEVDNKMHDFLVGDESHPKSDDLYAKLRSLAMHIKEEGHVPDLGLLVQTAPDEDNKNTHGCHQTREHSDVHIKA